MKGQPTGSHVNDGEEWYWQAFQRHQRQPIEEALAIDYLLSIGYTQTRIAERWGVRQPQISDTYRLLTLPEAALSALKNRRISAAHGAELRRLPDEDVVAFLDLALSRHLTVKQLRQIVGERKAQIAKPGKAA